MEPDLKPNEFRCFECGGVFDKGWTDEEAIEEEKRNFGANADPDGAELLCEECYLKFMAKIFN